MDEDSRWCKSCTLLEDVEPEAHEATCQDCRDSDLNKDLVMEDLYFARMWQALQYKKAGIPVMELIESVDDALVLQALDTRVQEIHREKAEEEREQPPQGGLFQIEDA